jgi:hypothetical protein
VRRFASVKQPRGGDGGVGHDAVAPEMVGDARVTACRAVVGAGPVRLARANVKQVVAAGARCVRLRGSNRRSVVGPRLERRVLEAEGGGWVQRGRSSVDDSGV